MVADIIFLILLAILAVLDYWIIRNKWQEKSNRVFFYFILIGIFWLSANYLENMPLGLKWNIFLVKIDFMFGPWFTYLFLIFALNFPQSRRRRIWELLLALPALIFSVLSLATNYIVKDILFINNNLFLVYGPLFIGDLVYTLAYFIIGFIKWLFDFRALTDRKRSQLLLVFSGIFCSGIIIITANLFLQNKMDISIFRLVPLSIVFFIIFTSYGILKHKLLDVRIIIQRSILYFLSFAIFLAVYILLIYLFGEVFILAKFSYSVSSILAAFLILTIYPHFKLYFQKKTDRFFFRYPYNVWKVLNYIHEKCSSSQDIDELVSQLINIIEKKLKINKILFVALNDSNKAYYLQNHNFSRKFVNMLKAIDKFPPQLNEYFCRHKQPFDFSQDQTALDKFIQEEKIFPYEVKQVFRDFGVKLFLPICNKNKLTAVMLMGAKLSEEEYYPQDHLFFNELIDNVGLAIENLRLYVDLKQYSINLEAKVAARTKELNELNENQAKFMADIYHELQTPLSILKGNLSLVNVKKFDPEEMRQIWPRMERSLDRLSNLIKDLIFLSKADVGKIEIGMAKFDLSLLVEEMYADSLILAEDKDIKFDAQIQPGIVINADREKIRSLLFNLLSNAFKFTPQGKEIKIMLAQDKSGAIFKIIDQGIGIAAKDLPNLFSRFYRLNNEMKNEGTGLGLAICKWIVEAHGGRIEAESQLGQGSTFTVILPLN